MNGQIVVHTYYQAATTVKEKQGEDSSVRNPIKPKQLERTKSELGEGGTSEMFNSTFGEFCRDLRLGASLP